MTIREHEDDDTDDEVQPSCFCSIPVKTIMDNVSECGNWIITLGIALTFVGIYGYNDELESDEGTSVNLALGFMAFGIFSCATGIACKVAACCVEEEEDISDPQMVGMV